MATEPAPERHRILPRFSDANGRPFDVGSRVDHGAGVGTVVGVDGDRILVGEPGGTNPASVRPSEVRLIERRRDRRCARGVGGLTVDTPEITLEFLRALVRLDTLPEDSWVGRVVYHPSAQAGDTPFWCGADQPEWLRKIDFDPDEDPPEDEPDWEALIYDRGVVREHRPGPWKGERRDVLFPPDVCAGEPFDNPPDWCLCYGANNLWTESPEEAP